MFRNRHATGVCSISVISSISPTSKVEKSTIAILPTSRLGVIALTVMLVASVALNVMLAVKVRQLTSAQNDVRAEHELKVGSVVPAIVAKRLDGGSESITYVGTDRPTVLYIFTPQCGWCERNLANLKALVDQKGEEYRFIGISLSRSGLEEYVANHRLGLPVYTDIPREAGESYRMGSTPQTIVVSPQGQVIQNWVGAYVGDDKSQIEAYFKVTLPGIPSESAVLN